MNYLKKPHIKMILFLSILALFSNEIYARKKAINISLHQNQGCPDTAICAKKVGRKRDSFIHILKKYSYKDQKRVTKLKMFQKTYGLPTKAWVKGKKNDAKVILWDSSCKHHRFETEQISSGKLFIKNITKPLKNIVFNKALLLTKKNKILEYTIPRGEVPIFIEKTNLYFIQDIEGQYFNISISKSGSINIKKNQTPKYFPEKTTCPQKLKDYYEKLNYHTDIFRGSFCKNIWNRSLKRYSTMLFGYSC